MGGTRHESLTAQTSSSVDLDSCPGQTLFNVQRSNQGFAIAICNSKQANQHEIALISADIRRQAQLPLCVFADIVVVARALNRASAALIAVSLEPSKSKVGTMSLLHGPFAYQGSQAPPPIFQNMQPNTLKPINPSLTSLGPPSL